MRRDQRRPRRDVRSGIWIPVFGVLLVGAVPLRAQEAVTAHLERLRTAKTPSARAASIDAIATHGAAARPALDALLRALQSTHAVEREAATRALVTLAPLAATRTADLARCLTTGHPGVRSAAHTVLQAVRRQSVDMFLQKDLRSSDAQTRLNALLRVEKLGARAAAHVADIVKLLEDQHSGSTAATVLGRQALPGTLPKVIALLRSTSSPACREHCVRLLPRLGCDEATEIPLLAHAIAQTKPRPPVDAVRRLCLLARRHAPARVIVARYLRQGSFDLRTTTASYLAGIGHHAGTEDLLRALLEFVKDERQYSHAIHALVSFGKRADPAIPDLARHLERGAVAQRRYTAKQLLLFASTCASTGPAFAHMVRSDDAQMVNIGLDGLRRSSPRSLEIDAALRHAMRHAVAKVRRNAALTTAILGNSEPTCRDLLLTLTKDDAADVRHAATAALRALAWRSPEAVAANLDADMDATLREALRTKRTRRRILLSWQRSTDPWYRHLRLSLATADIGEQTTDQVDVLVGFVMDEDYGLAQSAKIYLDALAAADLRVFRHLVHHGSWLFRGDVKAALARHGVAGTAELLAGLSNNHRDLHILKILARGGTQNAWTRRALSAMAKSASSSLRQAYAKTLAAIGTTKGEANDVHTARALALWRFRTRLNSATPPSLEEVRDVLVSDVPAAQAQVLDLLLRQDKVRLRRELIPQLIALGERTTDRSHLDISTRALQAAQVVRKRLGLSWQQAAPEVHAARFAADAREQARAALLMHPVNTPLPAGVLLEGMRDPNPGYRAFAIHRLRVAAIETRLHALPRLFAETDVTLRHQIGPVVWSLGDRGAAGLPFIEAAIRDGERLPNLDHFLVGLGPAATKLVRLRLEQQIEAIEERRAYSSSALHALHGRERLSDALLEPLVRAARSQPGKQVPSLALRLLLRVDARDDAARAKIQATFRSVLGRIEFGLDDRRRLVAELRRMGEAAAFAVPVLLPRIERFVFGGDPGGIEATRLLADLGADARVLAPRIRAALTATEQGIDAKLHRLVDVAATLPPTPDLLRAAEQLLSRTQNRPASLELLAALRPDHPQIWAAAKRKDAAVHKALGRAAAAQPLRMWERLTALDPRMLAAALQGIAAGPQPPARLLARVLALAEHEALVVRDAAAIALLAFGAKGRPAFREAVGGDGPRAGKLLRVASKTIRTKRDLIPELAHWIRALPASNLRSTLLHTLAGLGPRGINALELLPREIDLAAALGVALYHRDPATRHAAARAMIATRTDGNVRLLHRLRELRRSTIPGDARWARAALVSLADRLPLEDRIGTLQENLGSAGATLRVTILKKLLVLDTSDERILHMLTDSLLDPVASVRQTALECLTKLGGASRPARSVIRRLTKDSDADVRAAAEKALVTIR